MTGHRAAIFAAIKAGRNGKPFRAGEVEIIDSMLDGLGVVKDMTDWLGKALGLIKQFEGCRLTAYPDPGSGGDPWTIGVGHTGPEVKKGVVWTQAQADAALAADVSKFAIGVTQLLGSAPTTAGQKAALVSFAFNVGLGALKDSTLRRLHLEGKHAEAAAQFQKWVKASGRTLPGLVKRRAAEAEVYSGHL